MKMYMVGNPRGIQDAEFTKMGFELTSNFLEADIVQFMGGEDVSPFLYGEENTHSHNSPDRDLIEAGYFAWALRLDKPMVGICRGGQFLNVMCGGKMIQDVGGHTHSHMLNLIDGSKILATSTHHQMMVVGDSGHTIGWGELEEDIEVVWYPHEQALCFQPHPEYGRHPELREVYRKLIDRYLFKV